MHIVFTIANNSSVPYFNWFAEMAAKENQYRFTFIALCKERPQMIEDVGLHNCECFWIPFDHEERKTGMISSFFKIFRLLKKLKPDVVHAHLFDDALPTLFAAKLARVKVRAIVKADTGFHYQYAPIWMLLDKFNNWNATVIVPPSKEAEKFVLEHENAEKGKITMIHHGIPSKIFTNQSEEFKQELINKYNLKGKIVVGTVSRLIDWKGYDDIIAAAKIIVKEFPDIVFVFVGIGPQEMELKKKVKMANLENHIIFTGWMGRAYVPSFYGVLDVYLHAANFEPFGFVIPEAMMNGVPVVSTPTGSALDSIRHKENGYLLKYKDVDSMVKGLRFTINNGDFFKEKGKKKALEMFEFEEMFRNYINLYEKKLC